MNESILNAMNREDAIHYYKVGMPMITDDETLKQIDDALSREDLKVSESYKMADQIIDRYFETHKVICIEKVTYDYLDDSEDSFGAYHFDKFS